MTPIKYIGARPTYREGAYGSGLIFTQGKILNVEDDDLAKKLLKHPDVYIRGEGEEADKAPVVAKSEKSQEKKDKDKEDDAQDNRDTISQMTKAALGTYAKTHFNVDLDLTKKVGELRTQVTGLFDQFGTE